MRAAVSLSLLSLLSAAACHDTGGYDAAEAACDSSGPSAFEGAGHDEVEAPVEGPPGAGHQAAVEDAPAPQEPESDEVPYALDRPFQPTEVVALRVPDDAELPDGELGARVRRGRQLLTHTYEELPDHVGNQLRCTSCHLQGGTVAGAAPWVGITARFPQYRYRSARVDDVRDRVNNCFQRSMNGTPLDRDGEEMDAIVAYYEWLSTGYAKGQGVEGRGIPKLVLNHEPNVAHGEEVYEARCAVCHGKDGEGTYAEGSIYGFPALWGPRSFNIAAGMARLHTAAGFVKHNMPFGHGGRLSDDEAWDVAAYFTRQPRPDYPAKDADWPEGHRPPDARY